MFEDFIPKFKIDDAHVNTFFYSIVFFNYISNINFNGTLTFLYNLTAKEQIHTSWNLFIRDVF